MVLSASFVAFAEKSQARLLKEFEEKFLELPTDKVYPVSFDVTLTDFESDALSISEQMSLNTGNGTTVFGTKFIITGTATRHMKMSQKLIDEAYAYAFKNSGSIHNKAQILKALDLIDKIDERVMTQEEFVRELAGMTSMVAGHMIPLPGAGAVVTAVTDGILYGVYGSSESTTADNILTGTSYTLNAADVTAEVYESIPVKHLKFSKLMKGEQIARDASNVKGALGAAGKVADAASIFMMYKRSDERTQAKWATRIGKTWLASLSEFAALMNEYIRMKAYSDAEWSIAVKGQYSSPFDFRGEPCYQTWSIDLDLNKMWPEDNMAESIERYNNSVDGTYVGTLRANGAYNLSRYDSAYFVDKYPDHYPTFASGDKTRETANLWKEQERAKATTLTDKSKSSKCILNIEKPVVFEIHTGSMSSIAAGIVTDWGEYQEEMIGPEPEGEIDFTLQFFKMFEAKGGMEGLLFEYFDGHIIKSGVGSDIVPQRGNDVERAMVQAISFINDVKEEEVGSLGLIAVPKGYLTIDVSQDVLF